MTSFTFVMFSLQCLLNTSEQFQQVPHRFVVQHTLSPQQEVNEYWEPLNKCMESQDHLHWGLSDTGFVVE